MKLNYRWQIARQLRARSSNDTGMTLNGRSRSSEMSHFDRAHMTSYYRSTVTIAVSSSFSTYCQKVENRELYNYISYLYSTPPFDTAPERDRQTDRQNAHVNMALR